LKGGGKINLATYVQKDKNNSGFSRLECMITNKKTKSILLLGTQDKSTAPVKRHHIYDQDHK